jgi:hypothetical protein
MLMPAMDEAMVFFRGHFVVLDRLLSKELTQQIYPGCVRKPADHVFRDPARTHFVKLVRACKVKSLIGLVHRRFHAGVNKRVGFEHHHAGRTAVEVQ